MTSTGRTGTGVMTSAVREIVLAFGRHHSAGFQRLPVNPWRVIKTSNAKFG